MSVYLDGFFFFLSKCSHWDFKHCVEYKWWGWPSFLVSDHRGKAFNFPHLLWDQLWNFHMAFIMFLLYLSCGDFFLSLTDIKCFSIEKHLLKRPWIFYSVTVLYISHWFVYVEPAFHPKDKSYSVRCIILFKCCWLDFCFKHYFKFCTEVSLCMYLCIYSLTIYHNSTWCWLQSYSKTFIETPKKML